MDFKRILRTPMVWVVLIVGIGVLILSLQGAGGFTRIDTSAAEKLINDGKVQSAKLEVDKVDLTLKKGESYTGGDGVKDATRVQAYYIEQRGAGLVAGPQDPPAPRGLHRRDQRPELVRQPAGDGHPARPGPRPVLVPDEPDAGRWLQGHELRQEQGQAGDQGHPQGDLRRRGRCGRGRRGAARDQGVPRRARQVPGRRRQDPQGRPALRPARHRQDAAGPRRRRRGRRAVLLDLRLGLRRDVRRRRRLPRA